MAVSFSPWIMLIAVLIAFILKTHLKIYIKSAWLVFRLPGPRALPVIGHAHFALDSKRLLRTGTEAPKQFGLLMSTWISIFPYVLVIDPKHIQKILANSKHIEKSGLYKMMHNFIGEGLITSEGSNWKVHRKLMQPLFHLSILETFLAVFNKAGTLLVKKLQDYLATGKKEVQISAVINQIIFSLLAEAVLGVPIDSHASRKVQTESPYRSGSSSFLHRLLRPWLLFPALFRVTQLARQEIDHKNALISFTKGAMKERRRLYSEGVPIPEKCFLDHLLQLVDENPGVFTDDDCAQEAITLMLAGQDSVGSALGFTFHLLANNPKEQEKAMREQSTIFGDSTGPVTLADLRQMTYLDLCVKETLRLFPSVPLIARTIGDDVQLGKWHLPKGCGILISPFATQRLEEYYPDPHKFVPERFEPTAAAELPHYAWIPFSAGPRNCIGYKYAELQMKTVISTLLRNFQLSPVKGKEEVSLMYRLTLRAKGGIWVTLTPRHNNNADQTEQFR